MGLSVYLISMALCVLAGLLVGWYRARNTKETLESALRTLDYYKETYLRIQGWNIKRGNYDIRSFDKGQNWYAVREEPGTHAVTILGMSEEIFPGLLKEIDPANMPPDVAKNFG
jgi:hypothetical protein